MLFIEVVELIQPENVKQGHAWIRVKNESYNEIELRVDFDSIEGFHTPYVAERRGVDPYDITKHFDVRPTP
jgi:hypothetical protein